MVHSIQSPFYHACLIHPPLYVLVIHLLSILNHQRSIKNNPIENYNCCLSLVLHWMVEIMIFGIMHMREISLRVEITRTVYHDQFVHA